MIEHHRAPEEAHDKARPPGNKEANDGQRNGWHLLVSVQPAQFGIAGQIGHLGQIGLVVFLVEDPAEMAVDETLAARRMHIVFGVGMQVVMAMLGSPPQHTLLAAGLGKAGEQELHRTAGAVGAVREVAVITGDHAEHAQPIKRHTKRHRLPGDAGPDRRETGEMHQHEGHGRRIVDVLRRFRRVAVRGHVSSPLSAVSHGLASQRHPSHLHDNPDTYLRPGEHIEVWGGSRSSGADWRSKAKAFGRNSIG